MKSQEKGERALSTNLPSLEINPIGFMILAVFPFIFTFLLHVYTEGKLEPIALRIGKRMSNRRISNFLQRAFSPNLRYLTHRIFASAVRADTKQIAYMASCQLI